MGCSNFSASSSSVERPKLRLGSKPQSNPYLIVKNGQDFQEFEPKPQVINQQCAVYRFQCNLCDAGGYVGYTRGLHARVVGHTVTATLDPLCGNIMMIA